MGVKKREGPYDKVKKRIQLLFWACSKKGVFHMLLFITTFLHGGQIMSKTVTNRYFPDFS